MPPARDSGLDLHLLVMDTDCLTPTFLLTSIRHGESVSHGRARHKRLFPDILRAILNASMSGYPVYGFGWGGSLPSEIGISQPDGDLLTNSLFLFDNDKHLCCRGQTLVALRGGRLPLQATCKATCPAPTSPSLQLQVQLEPLWPLTSEFQA